MEIAQPTAPASFDYEEAPPPYSTLPNSPSEVGASMWTGPGATAAGGYTPRGFKLSHVDFVPKVVRKRFFKEDDHENFTTLVQRANNWLEEYDGIRVMSCETVTWTGLRSKDIYSDMSAFDKSMASGKSTKFIRGLRLWYLADTVPSPSRSTSRPIIHCRTYIPGKHERFDQLLNRVNETNTSDRMGGHVLSTETIRLTYPHGSDYRPSLLNCNLSYWKERPTSRKTVVFGIRVYTVLGEGTPDDLETLGYQDFVPDHNQRNKENKGYEVFCDVMERASRWVARQQGVRFTNLQTLSVKVKKRGAFEERCIFTEHRCANERLDLNGPNRSTHYLRIVRVYFVIPSSSAAPAQEPQAARLTYRTFAPAQVSPLTRRQASSYEGIKSLLERLNQWLQITGARVFCIETVPFRCTTGPLQMLGPEATYSKNGLPCLSKERWLHYIRLYLDGDYMEPPGAVSLVVPSIAVIGRA